MRITKILLGLLLLSIGEATGCLATEKPIWIQPAAHDESPVWGFCDGIRIGLNPASIRGLIHVYTPYLGQPAEQVLNFIAVEPIAQDDMHRGFSELEQSDLDGVTGKRIWSTDSEADCSPREASQPARGTISTIDGEETLTVFLVVEPFRNGAKVYVRVRFHADRPHEVELATFRYGDSAELDNCILTATMGNYARLRTLWLDGKTRNSKQIWPDYADDGFTPHAFIPASDMIRGRNGFSYLIASPDEKNPEKAVYDNRLPAWWHYTGCKATQYWYCTTPEAGLQGVVNGRVVYWGDLLPIPGGVSFENFELKQPYTRGAIFVFGASPLTPRSLLKTIQQ